MVLPCEGETEGGDSGIQEKRWLGLATRERDPAEGETQQIRFERQIRGRDWSL